MTEKFTFGEHPRCLEEMRHTMTSLKDAGALVTVETERVTRHEFVLHTVCAAFPPKEHPIKFTTLEEGL
jgi:hypothetical protein